MKTVIDTSKTKAVATRSGIWSTLDIVDAVNGLLEEDGTKVAPLAEGDIVEHENGYNVVISFVDVVN